MAERQIRRHFLSWDAPLLGEVVRWLGSDWWAGPLDLSHWLLVVPTRQAGRRLRAALAEHAAEKKQAVLAPRVVTPEVLLAGTGSADAATPLEALLAWVEVFQRVELGEFRDVFPVDPPRRDFAWALRLADEFARLQATLAEGGLALRDVAERAPESFPERARWRAIGELEQRQERVLARCHKRDPERCLRETAQRPPVPPGIQRIAVVGVPDPLPLAILALEQLAQHVPVEVLIGAPASEAENFDAWGRPVPEAWSRRDPPFGAFEQHVHLVSDPAEQAARIAALATQYPQVDGQLGVGVVAPEVAAAVETALRRAGMPVFNPAGEKLAARSWGQFLGRLADFARDPSFAHAAALARTTEILDWLAREWPEFEVTRWLAGLDELHCRHLPASLAEARRFAPAELEPGLRLLAGLHDEVVGGDFAPAVSATLTRVLNARAPRDDERGFAEGVGAWLEVLEECRGAARLFPHLRYEDWWRVAAAQYGAMRFEDEKPPGSIELQGWLELPFETAAHLVIAGCNEGSIPEAVTADPYLPESLRVALGLKSNRARFARDAFLLHALVASRAGQGRIDVLLAKSSATGEPLRPSRLLLQCSDAVLPARVEYLFRALGPSTTLPAWERPWALRPRRVASPARLSPTAFRSYLECPFRFYLRHVLKMEAVEPDKCELDALDFGTLCHAPLEKLALEPWRDCTDESVLAAMLVEEFDRVATRRFGSAPSVPVVAQFESARQRLRRAAQVQAIERARGWVTVATERAFDVPFGGVRLRGKIDRIDRHAETGEWRVLDYKTTDAPKPPVETHLGPPRAGVPEWALVTVEGRERAWRDLQLPLYVHALPAILPEIGPLPQCGYFLLPKAVTWTAIAPWHGYSPELHRAALDCAERVVEAIRAGRFWPPNEDIPPEYDGFADLFQRGVSASIAWEERR